MDGREPKGLSLTGLQQYSFRVARLAQRFLGARPSAHEAFTAGIVCDLGQLVLALKQRALFEQVLERVGKEGESQPDVERELLGVTHAEAGALLLSGWGLPFAIVETVAFHHDVNAVADGPVDVLAAVHAADALVGIISCGDPETALDRGFIERAGFTADLPAWRKMTERDLE